VATPTVAQNLAALGGASANPNYPPGFVNRTNTPPANDHSAEAQFYLQLGKVADYLAANLLKLSADDQDRNGTNHLSGASAEISRAIGVYLLNVPYASVQALGWKTALANILASPLCTWDPKIGFYQTMPAAPTDSAPIFIQQRAPNKWSLYPAYVPFFFWSGNLSFLRFLRYDNTFGFVFTDTFAHTIITTISACFYGPIAANPIANWAANAFQTLTVQPTFQSGSGSVFNPFQQIPLTQAIVNAQGPLTAQVLQAKLNAYNPGFVNDGFENADPNGAWLRDPAAMPGEYTNKLQAAANAVYSAEAKQEIMLALQFVGAFVAIATAGASIAANGWTVANGLSLASAFENSPFGLPSNAIKNILIAGKLLDLPSLCTSIGLDIPAAPEVASVASQGNSVSISDFSDLSDNLSNTVDMTDILPPDVPIVDSAGTDLASSSGLADVELNIEPVDPGYVTTSDLVTDGTDTSTADVAMASTASASTDTFGNFSPLKYLAGAAKVYSALTASKANGTAAPATANHPTVGTVTHLPDGSVSTVNANGSTTIRYADGTVRTILPSGKIVSGTGAGLGSILSNPLALGALAVGAFFLLKKR
jgi:hypothetical protein